MSKKCSTAQRFIRTEMTTYRIGTLVDTIIFSLYRVIVRPTKIIKDLRKDRKFLIFKVI